LLTNRHLLNDNKYFAPSIPKVVSVNEKNSWIKRRSESKRNIKLSLLQ
jgi:hypothetical protein